MKWKEGEWRGHDAALDGIRGLAILLVLFHHWGIPVPPASRFAPAVQAFVSCGWVGVDLFFVLSGFLITGILVDSLGADHALRNFYARRFLRIFPLYYGVLAVLFLLTVPLHLVWGAMPLPLVLYLQNTGLWVPLDGYRPLPGINLNPMWSLAVEEQFYLFWPVIVFLVRDIRKLMWIALGISGGALLLRLALAAMAVSPWYLYCLMPCRADSLMLGGVLALALRSSAYGSDLYARVLRWAPWVLGVTLSAIVATAVMQRGLPWQGSVTITTIGLTIIALASASLIACTQRPTFGQIFRTGWLRFLGRYSYGIYMLHLIAYVALYRWLARSILLPLVRNKTCAYVGGVLGIQVLTIAAAVLSFKFYETPFLKLKRRFESRRPVEPPSPS